MGPDLGSSGPDPLEIWFIILFQQEFDFFDILEDNNLGILKIREKYDLNFFIYRRNVVLHKPTELFPYQKLFFHLPISLRIRYELSFSIKTLVIFYHFNQNNSSFMRFNHSDFIFRLHFLICNFHVIPCA